MSSATPRSGPKRCPEPPYQRVREAVHAEHDVEIARLDVGVVVRVERPAERGERSRRRGDGELHARHVDAEHRRELGILPTIRRVAPRRVRSTTTKAASTAIRSP